MRRSQQFPDSFWGRWIVGCQFDERDDDEVALVHPRVRNFQPGLADPLVPIHQNIQIQRARAVANACLPIPPEFFFDPQQALEQGSRAQIGLQCDHRIQKARLVGKSHRSGGIQGGSPGQASERFQPLRGSRHRDFRVSGRAGQV